MTISFTKTRLPYGWMGSMAPWPVALNQVCGRTAEHLFQSLRFPPGSEVARAILAERSPMAAKLVAKANTPEMRHKPCSDEDVAMMREVVRLKVAQHPQMREWLLATGHELIVEDCTRRRRGNGLFWGAARTGPTTWEGENMLGTIWMDLREGLRA